MLRQSLLTRPSPTRRSPAWAHAQQRGQSRDDLLDALTRHIQICGEITDTQQRLSCYDRLQTQVGGVHAAGPADADALAVAARAATAAEPPPPPDHGDQRRIVDQQRAAVAAVPVAAAACAPAARRAGRRRRHVGRPVAIDGSRRRRRGIPTPPSIRAARPTAPPEATGPKPQPQMRRTGPRPIPNFVDAAAAGDAGRDQPDLWRFALLAGHGDAHLQHAAGRQHPGGVHLHECRTAGRRRTISGRCSSSPASRSPPS